ncbi:MAG: methyltransferase [Thermoprotei archaeon]
MITNRLRGEKLDLCIDLGCGTGILGIHLLCSNICNKTVFVDIDKDALNTTHYNLYHTKLFPRALLILTENAYSLFEENADLVVANPPYLPGTPIYHLDHTVVSGPIGYERPLLFIATAYKLLKRSGILYLVYSSLSNADVIEAYLKKFFDIRYKTTKRFFYEELYGVEAIKK